MKVLHAVFHCVLIALALLLPLTLIEGRAAANDTPSDGAASIEGSIGRIEYKPRHWRGTGVTTYWKDTDGIDPGTAGCHYEVNARGERFPGARIFGEACKSRTVLVESNPGKGDLHSHKDDIGHPDLFDCRQWCQFAKNASFGRCVAAPAPSPCGHRVQSAKCVCHN